MISETKPITGQKRKEKCYMNRVFVRTKKENRKVQFSIKEVFVRFSYLNGGFFYPQLPFVSFAINNHTRSPFFHLR